MTSSLTAAERSALSRHEMLEVTVGTQLRHHREADALVGGGGRPAGSASGTLGAGVSVDAHGDQGEACEGMENGWGRSARVELSVDRTRAAARGILLESFDSRATAVTSGAGLMDWCAVSRTLMPPTRTGSRTHLRQWPPRRRRRTHGWYRRRARTPLRLRVGSVEGRQRRGGGGGRANFSRDARMGKGKAEVSEVVRGVIAHLARWRDRQCRSRPRQGAGPT